MATIGSYPHPTQADLVDVAADIQKLADAIHTEVGDGLASGVVEMPAQKYLANSFGQGVAVTLPSSWAGKTYYVMTQKMDADSASAPLMGVVGRANFGSGVVDLYLANTSSNPITTTQPTKLMWFATLQQNRP